MGLTDSLLWEVQLRWPDSSTPTLFLTLSNREREAPHEQSDGWVNLDLQLTEVDEFAIRQGARTTRVVISDGLRLIPVGDRIAIDFSGNGANETPSVEELRESEAYAIGRLLRFAVRPYQRG